MRIAVVCPNYSQGRSYQENIWAEQLSRAGHTVRLFFAGKKDSPPRVIHEPGGDYEIQQAATVHLPRAAFLSRTAAVLVRKFQPDMIVLCGDKLFGRSVCKDPGLTNVPLISTYSENLGMHEFDWRKPGISLRQRLWAIGFAITRGGPIRTACKRSVLIVGNTPQSREIILRLVPMEERAAINDKMIDMPLGFSPQHFGYFPQTREKVREELGIGREDVLVCVSSQFSPAKEPFVKLIIEALRQVMAHESTLRAVTVGFSEKPENAEVSRRVGAAIDSGPHADRFIRHPFADRTRLCEIYNASDIAAFGRASISCQEALGTGIVACLADDGSLNHLVTRADQGVFFRPNDVDDLALKLAEAVRMITRHQGPQREVFRQSLADTARWLGFDRIIASIMEQARQRISGTARET